VVTEVTQSCHGPSADIARLVDLSKGATVQWT
jgi:hypothetical protein